MDITDEVSSRLRHMAADLAAIRDKISGGGIRHQSGTESADVLKALSATEDGLEDLRGIVSGSRAVRETARHSPDTGPKGPSAGLASSSHATKENAPHSSHYKGRRVEPIDLIEAWNMCFHLGNAVKYICRVPKGGLEERQKDLEKARWYLDRCLSVRHE